MNIKEPKLNCKNKANKFKNNIKEKKNRKINFQFNFNKRDKNWLQYNKGCHSFNSKNKELLLSFKRQTIN